MASDLVYEGTAAAPAAGAVVAESAALASGRYRVTVAVHLEGSGTPAAADLDNMALYSGTAKIGVLAVPEAKSVVTSSPELVIDVASGDKVSVQAVGNATASVTYAAQLTVRTEALY